MANETTIQQNIRLALGSLSNVRMFRNNVGTATTEDGRFIQFGLCKGSSDLIGYVSKEITPDMVGKRVAIFSALEVKTAKNKATTQQQAFINRVCLDGGIAGIVRNEQEALSLCQ